MEKWIMVEVAVRVDSKKKDVSDIMDDVEIEVNGDDVCEYHVENYYDFDC